MSPESLTQMWERSRCSRNSTLIAFEISELLNDSNQENPMRLKIQRTVEKTNQTTNLPKKQTKQTALTNDGN